MVPAPRGSAPGVSRAVAPLDLPAGAIHIHWLEHDPARGREPLRGVLGRYLGVGADAVALADEAGSSKPRLRSDARGLRFNWSHTPGLAAVAVARDTDVGIDVEWAHRPVRAAALATRHYAGSEVAWLQALPAAARGAGFLRLWTGKEAVLKALGRGIWCLEGVHLAARADGTLALLAAHFPEAQDAPLALQALRAPLPGVLAALAWRGGGRQLLHFRGGEALSAAALLPVPRWEIP